MSISFDNLAVNRNLLLGLPFGEGAGVITQDMAKPNRLVTMTDPGGGSFVWGNLATGIPYLQFVAVGGGAADGVYLSCPAADTVDLNFTSGDYSIGGWINWDSTGGDSEYIIGRGVVETDGWDCYLAISGGRNTLSHRHAHATGGAGNLKSECFSTGWTPGTWHFFGISRSGLYPLHYRDAVSLEMDYGAGTMLDPDTALRDLVIGARNSKDDHWYRGYMWNIRVWDRALEGIE